jgi:hypothetical protein
MSNRITIEKINWSNGDLHIIGKEIEMEAAVLKPAARVLADSDHLAFIYILETEDTYFYLSIPKDYWADLKKVIMENSSVILFINQHEIKLEGIVEELKELVSNIDGNANYGDDMVKEVENHFL